MANKVRKQSYRFMHVILNQCIRGKMTQTMFSIFLHGMLRLLAYIIGISLFASFFGITAFATGGISESTSDIIKTIPDLQIPALVFLVLLNFISCFIGEMLTYGLYKITGSLVLNKAASIKDIFSAFKDKSQKVLKAALTFAAINTAVIIILFILTLAAGSFLAPQLAQLIERFGNSASLIALVAAFLLLTAILTFPFTFVYLILFTRKETGVGQSFSISWKMLCHQVFHFLAFVIYSGGTDLIAVIVIQFFLFLLPAGENANPALQMLATFLSFLGIISEYRALSRFYLGTSIYFYCEAGIIHPHGGKELEMADLPESIENTPDAEERIPNAGSESAGGEENLQ